MSKVLLPTAQTINILSHEIDTSSTARKWFAAVGSYDAQLQDGGHTKDATRTWVLHTKKRILGNNILKYPGIIGRMHLLFEYTERSGRSFSDVVILHGKQNV